MNIFAYFHKVLHFSASKGRCTTVDIKNFSWEFELSAGSKKPRSKSFLNYY
jgi:hypothetical protein